MNNLKIFIVKNKSDFEKTIEIRRQVFIKEQNVPEEIEIDGFDSKSEHFIAYFSNEPIGCARIRADNNIVKLERIAIIQKHRGKGFGQQLTNFLIDYCKNQDYKEIHLHSQTYIADFYEKLGFIPIGKTFYDAGIEHIEMYMKIN